jgi:hypothetical protein
VIGAQGAGKSSIGRSLAARFERGAFVEGDVLWRMVVAGRVDMSPEPEPEAAAQLALRYRHGAMLCESFVAAGFTAVHAENMYGPLVLDHLRVLRCPASLVVLRPRIDVVERRDRDRGGGAYDAWLAAGTSRLDAVARFDAWLAETPPVGLWVDSSDLSVADTVDLIVDRWSEAAVVLPFS